MNYAQEQRLRFIDCMLKFPGRSRYMKVSPQYLHVCRDDKEPAGVSFERLMDALMERK